MAQASLSHPQKLTPASAIVYQWTDLTKRFNDLDPNSDVYLYEDILSFTNQKQFKTLGQKTILKSARGIVQSMHPKFSRRTSDPEIGKKLVVLLVWGYSGLLRSEIMCHTYLLMIDFRSDGPPFDLYIFEPLEVSDNNPRLRSWPKLVADMGYMSKVIKKRIIDRSAKTIVFHGNQSIEENLCFYNLTSVATKIASDGADDGLRSFFSRYENYEVVHTK